MYTPKISPALIHRLWLLKKKTGLSMVNLAEQAIRAGLPILERVAEEEEENCGA